MTEMVYRSVSDKWHFARRDGRSKCVGGQLVAPGRPAATISVDRRCNSNGCRVQWRNVEVLSIVEDIARKASYD